MYWLCLFNRGHFTRNVVYLNIHSPLKEVKL